MINFQGIGDHIFSEPFSGVQPDGDMPGETRRQMRQRPPGQREEAIRRVSILFPFGAT